MLLERMRGGALPRERPKPRREDCPAGAPWPRLRPKALGAVRRQGSVRAGLRAYGPVRRRQSGTGREVERRIANEVWGAWLRAKWEALKGREANERIRGDTEGGWSTSERRAGRRPGGGATRCEWVGLLPAGVAYGNSTVLAQAEPKLSPSASCKCLGHPCYCCGPGPGSGCGSSTDSFLSTAHSGPDCGGGAAGSHPQGTGERERAMGLGQDGAGSQVHAASARPQLLPNRGIDDILEDQVEPEGKSPTPRFGGVGD